MKALALASVTLDDGMVDGDELPWCIFFFFIIFLIIFLRGTCVICGSVISLVVDVVVPWLDCEIGCCDVGVADVGGIADEDGWGGEMGCWADGEGDAEETGADMVTLRSTAFGTAEPWDAAAAVTPELTWLAGRFDTTLMTRLNASEYRDRRIIDLFEYSLYRERKISKN